MRCSVCGAEAADSARFCEMCGSPLQAQGQGSASQPGFTSAGAPADVSASSGVSGDYPYGSTGASGSAYQGQPYAQPGYQADQQQSSYWSAGQPYAPVPKPAGKQASNAPFVLSIIALVMALLGLFPVSLILAIIALAMNSGQKKRGEVSTKQTPTFVMGIISLILSIFVAIVSIIVGGALWLYLVDNDFDFDSDTQGSPIVVTQTDSQDAQSAVGTWKVKSMKTEGRTFGEEYLELMESLGMKVEVVLAENGVASLELLGESETGRWEDRGSGTIAITLGDDTIEGTLAGDELFLAANGDELVLSRVSEEAVAEPSSNATDGVKAQGIAELLSTLEDEVEDAADEADEGRGATADSTASASASAQSSSAEERS